MRRSFKMFCFCCVGYKHSLQSSLCTFLSFHPSWFRRVMTASLRWKALSPWCLSVQRSTLSAGWGKQNTDYKTLILRHSLWHVQFSIFHVIEHSAKETWLLLKRHFYCLQTLPLISQSRRLVREGLVTELIDFSLKDTERNIYLHLFNDYLLLSLQKEWVGIWCRVADHNIDLK